MSYAEYLARRVAFAALSAYLVVTATFALVTFTPNTALGGRLGAAAYYQRATAEELEQIRRTFLEARGLDEPVLQRYLDWLIDVSTLDWGYSFAYREPVWSVLETRVPTTLEYVIPGVILAVVLGVLLGLLAATLRGSVPDWTIRVGSYTLLGVPAFVGLVWYTAVGGATLKTVGGSVYVASPHPQVLAAAAVAATLLAGQIRFARIASLEQAGKSFTKLLRAKGANRLRVARHVLRNAAIPIVSLSVTEILGVLVLNIYVIEEILEIEGLAGASLFAVRERDLPLIIGTTMILVFVGILGNLLQDVLYGYLDPRISAE
ncbi:ABC transporter permease [Halobacterium litoreum]|uniref:ABC transporter permease n=1 Tax=Halobacterium litoreum TaxID=2039234 RepID=A0ABD5NDQ3_9EURY|nr:ABC transporter permease [Halobacterium litoreum]UHH13734.1 ABC transporter permease [Halobacterium litoreum]